jgi:hypothetical protein
MLKEYRMSQPPRQYAPTPHCPYVEQHGESCGQLVPGPHWGAELAVMPEMKNIAASAAAALKECRILMCISGFR